jgi:hypothetical protein
VYHILLYKDQILAKVSRYWEQPHQYGIAVPKTVYTTLKLDEESGTKILKAAVEKETTNVQLIFNVLEHGKSVPIGFQHIKCNMIFDVKFDSNQKARFGADDHLTKPNLSLIYSSVVTTDRVVQSILEEEKMTDFRKSGYLNNVR